MNTHHNYDTIVIGGGPAGSTVATLVAEQGYRVLLLERESEPKFKISDSPILNFCSDSGNILDLQTPRYAGKTAIKPFPTEVQCTVLFTHG